MYYLFVATTALCICSSIVNGFFAPQIRGGQLSRLQMSQKPAKGAGFNYDPSNYKDSNSGNYRRLGDQLAAAKAEDEKLARERDEIIRKEQMAAMMLRKENETFWGTPDSTIVATSDRFFVPPSVLQVIDDLDNQLIGLTPVKQKMRRYANQMLSHKIRK